MPFDAASPLRTPAPPSTVQQLVARKALATDTWNGPSLQLVDSAVARLFPLRHGHGWWTDLVTLGWIPGCARRDAVTLDPAMLQATHALLDHTHALLARPDQWLRHAFYAAHHHRDRYCLLGALRVAALAHRQFDLTPVDLMPALNVYIAAQAALRRTVPRRIRLHAHHHWDSLASINDDMRLFHRDLTGWFVAAHAELARHG